MNERVSGVDRHHNLSIDQSMTNYIHYYYLQNNLLTVFREYAKGSLLDIGCGNKPYKEFLMSFVESYIGCDAVQSSLYEVDIICNADNIPLDNSSFDTIISTQVLEHMGESQGLINEAYRLLKGEGTFVLSAPFFYPIHEAPYDFYRYTKYGLLFMLEKAGFREIKILACGGKWAMIGQMLCLGAFSYFPRNKIRKYISKLGLYISNRLFIWLDEKNRDELYTQNYVVVCKK